MTNDERMTNEQMTKRLSLVHSSFVLRLARPPTSLISHRLLGHSFVIRYSSFVISFLSLFLSACSKRPTLPTVSADISQQLVVPDHGAYTGAYIDFGDEEDDVTLEAIENFEKMVGKHQAIVGSSSYWGE